VTDRFACVFCRHPVDAPRPHCRPHGPAFERLHTQALRLRSRDAITAIEALALTVWPPPAVVDALLEPAAPQFAEDESREALLSGVLGWA
jgi:hypothetical protein